MTRSAPETGRFYYMRLFADNGYLNVPDIIGAGFTFNIILSGRGVGKTFGFLKYMREEAAAGLGRFAYLRRLQTQIDICGKAEFNPFKRLDTLYHMNTTVKSISKYSSGFYADDMQLLGYGLALSTFGSLRGFDGSDITSILFEECIPKQGEHRLKQEASMLWDAYETINRNRELEGEAPVRLFCIGNSNNTAADLLVDMGLVQRVERMKEKGVELYQDRKRSLQLIVLGSTSKGEQKRDTALYRFLGEDSGYSAAALDNDPEEEWGRVNRSRPLREYRPIVTVGDITIYEHKSRYEYYVTAHRSGDPPRYGTGPMDLERFKIKYKADLWAAMMKNKVVYERTNDEILLTKYIQS